MHNLLDKIKLKKQKLLVPIWSYTCIQNVSDGFGTWVERVTAVNNAGSILSANQTYSGQWKRRCLL